MAVGDITAVALATITAVSGSSFCSSAVVAGAETAAVSAADPPEGGVSPALIRFLLHVLFSLISLL